MLLMKLKNGEKFAFLELAYYVANIDGEFGQEEKNIIEEYCAEMGIDNIDYSMEELDLEEILSKIKILKSQKIVLLELMILIHSDNKFHYLEQEVIDKIVSFYNISKKNIDIYSQWGEMVSALYSQGCLLVGDNNA